MVDFFSQLFDINIPLFLVINFYLAFGALSLILQSNFTFLKWLHVPAGKSATNAKLLGGVALSIPLLVSSIGLKLMINLDSAESHILNLMILPLVLVTVYGYIDDKYEVRARIKLAMQFISVVGFCYFSKDIINPSYPYFAFIMSSIIGLALLNGTNLLDGLDTLAVKMGIVTSLAFMILSIVAKSLTGTIISGVTISSLLAFYYFNREPAKIYLGEIGGSLLGLTFFFQANICYSKLHLTYGHFETQFLIFIAAILPLSELGISFIRRIWTKKSPFRGDRLHLHYIMKNKLQISATKTSNIIGQNSLILVMCGLILALNLRPSIAFSFAFISLATFYIKTCGNYWSSAKDISKRKGLFNHIRHEAIHVINIRDYSDIDLNHSILNEAKNFEHHDKKAA